LIGNDHRRATLVAVYSLILSASAAAFALPAQASAHRAPASSAASAPAPAADAGISVTIVRDGVDSTYLTRATTVGAFLAERGIVASPADSLSPAADAPLADGTRIDYRAAVAVQLYVGGQRRDVVTTAPDVATLLDEQNVKLGESDSVDPQPSQRLDAGTVVRVNRETVWTTLRKQLLPAGIVHRYSPALPEGTTKTLFAGRPGERDVTLHFVQRDDRPIESQVVASRVVRQPRARIVIHGIGEYAAFARLAERGFNATIGLARSALQMMATAYTASCYGCTGYAANGMRAGHGIVAVDPRVIPLGTRLYIPGYGSAIAGDTGGAIVGRRIDLGFNSLGDALQFGRRAITVYVLR
jgi:3D (Asp-Asp-Asp) domain-containing protein